MKVWLAVVIVVGSGISWSMLSRVAEECTGDWVAESASDSLELPPQERGVTEATYTWPAGALEISTRAHWRYELEHVPAELALTFLEVEDKERFFYEQLKDNYVVNVYAAEDTSPFQVAGTGSEGR